VGRKLFFPIWMIAFLSIFLCEISSAQNTSFFERGVSLLEQGKYKKSIGEDALNNFKKAFNENKDLGPKIANQLIEYSNKLSAEDKIYDLFGEDAQSVLDEALKFDPTLKDKVINLHLNFLKSYLDQKRYTAADLSCMYLRDYGAGKQAFNIIQPVASTLPTSAQIDETIKAYKCMNTALLKDPLRLEMLTDLAMQRFSIYLCDDKIREAFNFYKQFLDLIDDNASQMYFVQYIRNLADKKLSDNRPDLAMLFYDEMRFNFPKQTTNKDIDYIKNCINLIGQNNFNDFISFYDNFKAILSLRYFGNLDFNFLTTTGDIDIEKTSFSQIFSPEETAYFYYDTGRVTSNTHGFLLSDEAIYWKDNILDVYKRLAFSDLQKCQLIYEKQYPFSFTGWKLRFYDENKEYDLRLTKISDESLLIFVGAILSYINANTEQKIPLHIEEHEEKILEGSLWERHKDVVEDLAWEFFSEVVGNYGGGGNSANLKSVNITKESKIPKGGVALKSTQPKLNDISKTIIDKTRILYFKAKLTPITIKEETRGFFKSRKNFEFKNSEGAIVKGKLIDFVDKRKYVKMKFVAHNSSISKGQMTSRGFYRDSKTFWSEYAKTNPEALSANNLKLIAKGRSPIVDKQWISVHPSHKGFLGETIDHHHWNHGAKAYPLPETLHRFGENYAKWH
jgi:hypothetical protein